MGAPEGVGGGGYTVPYALTQIVTIVYIVRAMQLPSVAMQCLEILAYFSAYCCPNDLRSTPCMNYCIVYMLVGGWGVFFCSLSFRSIQL